MSAVEKIFEVIGEKVMEKGLRPSAESPKKKKDRMNWGFRELDDKFDFATNLHSTSTETELTDLEDAKEVLKTEKLKRLSWKEARTKRLKSNSQKTISAINSSELPPPIPKSILEKSLKNNNYSSKNFKDRLQDNIVKVEKLHDAFYQLDPDVVGKKYSLGGSKLLAKEKAFAKKKSVAAINNSEYTKLITERISNCFNEDFDSNKKDTGIDQ